MPIASEPVLLPDVTRTLARSPAGVPRQKGRRGGLFTLSPRDACQGEDYAISLFSTMR